MSAVGTELQPREDGRIDEAAVLGGAATPRHGRRSGALAFIRALNAVLAVAMIALFAVHSVGNGLQMIGIGLVQPRAVSYALLATTLAHIVIGIVLTIATLRAQREAGVSYFGANKRFWAVRLTGLAIVVLVLLHLVVFWLPDSWPIHLNAFGAPELVYSILLVAAIAVHVMASMQPLMISLGIGSPQGRAIDAIVVLAVIVLIAAVAFAIYFLRWSVI